MITLAQQYENGCNGSKYTLVVFLSLSLAPRASPKVKRIHTALIAVSVTV